MKGFKVFNPDWRCLSFQYEVGKCYKHEGQLIPCKSGFHFCKNLSDCFSYYRFDSKNKVAEIEATGNIDTDDDIKFVTDEIKIIRELNWGEVLELCNTGKNNSGICNSGNYNSGSRNSGFYNSGNHNSGDYNSGWSNSGGRNSGDSNSGDFNTGNQNSGYRNSGNLNSGNWNSGDYNSGNLNSGNYNIGFRNAGNRNSGQNNSGYENSGDWNAGKFNSGYGNCGNANSGEYNTGWCNSGNHNSGNFNSINYSTGFFNNTTPETITVFNKEIPLDRIDEITGNIGYFQFKRHVKLNKWISYIKMSDEEKEKYPDAKNMGGYLKTYSYKDACKNAWDGMTDEEKEEFKKLPNFDPDVFWDITGIDINE